MTDHHEGPRPGLRAARERRNWTQKEAAENLQSLAFYTNGDTSTAANGDMVSKWERGEKGISPYYRRLLIELYEADAHALDMAPTAEEMRLAPWSEQLRYWREEVMEWSQLEFCEHHTYHAYQLGEIHTYNGEPTEMGLKALWRWESGAVQTLQHRNRRILKAMGAPLPPRSIKKGERRHPPAPDHLPAEVLTRPDFRSACARRDIGAVFEIARRYGGPGFTASHLARRCELTASRVIEYIERRREVTGLDVFLRIADNLHIPGEMFDFAPRGWEDEHSPSRVADEDETPVVGVSSGSPTPDYTKEGDDVKRQAFLRSFAAVAAGVAIGDPIAEAIGRGMAGATPSRVGTADIEHVNNSIRMFDQWQDLYGGGACLDAIAGQVNWATRLLGATATDSVKTELHSSVGFLVNIAGWGAFDAGSHDRAKRYFELALQCAEEASDWGLRANILSDMARQAVYIGRADDGLSFIELAQVRQDRQAPAARSMLSTVRARALAKTGRADEAYSAITQAEDHFSYRSDDDHAPEWIAYFGPAELAGDSGHALTDIALKGHYVETARQRLRASLDSYAPSQARARAFSLGKLALLELHSGDADAGVAYASASLDAEGPLQSKRAKDDLTQIHWELGQHRTQPAAELRERIGAALPTGKA